ncbi:MAG: SurA N-terminal domain-containing protein, partial [Burkholderiaceae bacterium]
MQKINSIVPIKTCFIATLAIALSGSPSVQAQDKSASSRQPELVDTIVAVVNTDVITLKELNERIKSIEQRMSRQKMQLPPRELLRKQVIERMILNRAQIQQAREFGIRVDDLALDRAIARIAEQNGIPVQNLRDQLERDGVSFARFREEVREEITLQRLREREVDNKLQITESEIDSFLASSATTSTDAQQEINIAQILVRIPENASAQQIADRKKRAEQAIEQLKSGG